ncbi:MAG: extracellular solute-binding protein [Roseiarcus sp.]|jgi:microcin C transport system substrate-binding protein|uniref:extracellular solute-binding protein n=1 Tax=Roseiarcus sp. TaxID=1969460 RepID=UPI003C25DCF2
MGSTITRRGALTGSAALAALAVVGGGRARADDWVETHGLSSFGDLALPPDFKRLAYVNPDAPKGGLLSLQITATSGNQNFDTFDTLNIFSKRGDGAAGMSATFDTLMSGNGDEPDSLYGLIARAVSVSPDKLGYRFLLRPEARFADGSKVTAADVKFSLDVLKEKAHPTYSQLLVEVDGVDAEADDVALVRFVKERSRDAHLVVAGMPIFSAAWWKGRDFDAATLEAPLGSGAYRVKTFEQGRFIEYELSDDYWAKDLPINVGQNNFRRLRFEYYRERQVAFEAFKAGAINFHQEYTARIWATGYDFPAFNDGRVKKETLHNGAPTGSQGWYFNTRREQFKDPRVREALGLAFDFEWTNKNVMFSSYKRVISYFQNSAMEAVGPPSPDELKILESLRGTIPASVFGDPYVPPVSDGSGSDRALLKRANEMLLSAGCAREGGVLKLPGGKPFTIEFLDSSDALQPHTQSFQQNLRKLGIDAQSRIVDAAQYKSRTENFDFDVVTAAFGGSVTPGSELQVFLGSKAATMEGSRNLSGIADPLVDALIEWIIRAPTRDTLNVACRVLDRVLRAAHYWVPMWYSDAARVAYWDAFSRPATQPKLGVGAPDTWWWDEDKAKKIGL